jgi:hypothetical protein
MEGGGVLWGEGTMFSTLPPYFLGLPPALGGGRFGWAFPVPCFSPPATITETAFGLESVAFVAVHNMSCVPSDDVVGA